MHLFTLRSFFVLALFACSIGAQAQCTDQVVHTSGNQVVNGIDVTVTHINFVDTITNYCPSVTIPYRIGYMGSIGAGGGQYNFAFSPAASSVTLNFSGIDATSSYSDEVMLSIDGSHYTIPAPGQNNGCDAMAVLNSNGNITGNANGQKSGWKSLTVPGPIHTLAVANYPVGTSGGAAFSIFVCNADLGVSAQAQTSVRLYPNPFETQLNVSTNSNDEAVIMLYDVLSRPVLQHSFVGNATIDVAALPAGVYYYELQMKNGVVQKGKLVKMI